MRYDTRVRSLSEEVSTLTQHMSKYRRERDTYKEMLEGAQKTIAELKGSSGGAYRTSRADNATEVTTKKAFSCSKFWAEWRRVLLTHHHSFLAILNKLKLNDNFNLVFFQIFSLLTWVANYLFVT